MHFLKRTKFLRILCVLVIIPFLISGCGEAEEKEKKIVWSGFDSDSAYVIDKKTLIVGVTDFEPLDYKQDGKWVGFDAEMAQVFGESLGVAVVIREIEWDKKVSLLEDGEIDCVWNGMTLTDDVKSSMSCSEAYLDNAQIIVVPKKKAKDFDDEKDCVHLLFAVENESAGESILKSKKFRYNVVGSQMEALKAVSGGKSDAAVIDSILAGALTGEGKKYEDLTYTVSLSSEKYGVGFRKGSDLAEKLNAFLKEKQSDGTIDEKAEKYGVQAALLAVGD